MKSPFTQLLVRWLVLALGVMLATKIVPGIKCEDGPTLIAVVLVLSFCNAILKPLLVLFTLPFILITMGLGVLVINALLFLLVGNLVPGFEVAGFWSAFGGAFVVSVTNWIVSAFTREAEPDEGTPDEGAPYERTPAKRRPAKRKPAKRKPKGDDVIDI